MRCATLGPCNAKPRPPPPAPRSRCAVSPSSVRRSTSDAQVAPQMAGASPAAAPVSGPTVSGFAAPQRGGRERRTVQASRVTTSRRGNSAADTAEGTAMPLLYEAHCTQRAHAETVDRINRSGYRLAYREEAARLLQAE